MNSMYHKTFMTLLIASTLMYLLLVDGGGRDTSEAKTFITNKGYYSETNLYYDGVLDRIENKGLAVILIEELKEEIIMPINELPVGSKEQTWFNLMASDEEFIVISINEKGTKQKAVKSKEVMERLRKKNKTNYHMNK